MELRHLRYFVVVAEELHFGRAAKRLHIVQSALSKQIADLEREVGVELLYRNKREVRLTVAGEAFLSEVRQVLDKAEGALQTARRTAAGQIGRLAVGFVGAATYSMIPEVLDMCRERIPNVELTLHERTSTEQIQMLHDDSIQVGFVRPLIGDDTLVIQTVLKEPLVVMLPEDHPLTELDEVPLAALRNEPFVVVPRSKEPGFHDYYITLCHQAGFSPNVVQEAQQIHTIASLVAAKMGVSLAGAAIENLQRPGLVYKRLQDAQPGFELAVAYRRGNNDPALGAFLELVTELSLDRE